MNIGFDAKRAFQNFTGLGNYSRFIIESLLKYIPENDYFLYCSKYKIQDSRFKVQDLWFKNGNLQLRTQNRSDGRSELRIPFWRSWLINNDLQRDKINIYHGLSNEIPFGIRKTGIKSVVTIHDLIFERYPELYPIIDRFIYRKKFRYACENADAIIAVSEQTKRDIVDFYKIPKEKIEVIYQDCQEIFKPHRSDGRPRPLSRREGSELLKKYNIQKPYILCVASFSERKNQLRLIQAFRELGMNDFELVLVGGKSKYLKEIEVLLSKSDASVRVLTEVPSADLPALYQNAELFVYPSIFEGFGIPIIEALHSGVPVVAATGSCLEEAGGNGALYANPLDVSDLAEKMNQVLSDKNLSNQLVLNGKEYVKRFSGNLIAKQLNDLYLRL